MHDTRNIDTAALVLRIGLGLVFISHGLLKVLVYTLPGTAQFFDSVGLPGWGAYPVTFLEIAGGALLVLGLGVRWVSVAVIPVLLGALYVHAGNGWLFTNESGGWEYPAFLTVAAIAQALLGAGAYAVKVPRPTRRPVAA